MTDRKHGREAARRRAAQAAAREAARRRRRRMQVGVLGALAVLVVLSLLLALVPDGDDGDDIDTFGAEETSSTTVAADDDAEFEYGTGACPPAEKPDEAPTSFDDAPQRCIEDDVDYGAVVETTEGTFTIDLLEGAAPGTVNNFVVLARWGWFDDVAVHRVVPGFVIQTGDPVGDPPGTGGPGYTIPDEHPSAISDYVAGAVAMANTGAPGSGGSQWFVCIDCSILPTPTYSLFGQVVDGIDVVQAINALGQGDGPPTKDVRVVSVTITET